MIQVATKFHEKDGRPHIKMIGVTEKYLSKTEIDSILKYGKNQHVTYRHNHPAGERKGEILGTVLTVEETMVPDKDGNSYRGLEIDAELLDYTEYQRDTIKYCKLKDEAGDPIHCSIGTQSFGEPGKEPVDSRPFEWTLTDIPHCKECSAVDIKMEDAKALEIAELKASLDSALGISKTKDTKIHELEDKIKAIESTTVSRTQKFEEDLKTKVEAVKKVYEDEFIKMSKELEDVKTLLLEQKKDPIIKSIFELEEDEYLRDNYYTTLTLEKLNERLEYVTSHHVPTARPQIQRMEAAQTAASGKVSAFRATMTKKFEQVDPALAKILRGGVLTDGERQAYGGRP